MPQRRQFGSENYHWVWWCGKRPALPPVLLCTSTETQQGQGFQGRCIGPLRATSKKGTQTGAFFAFKPARKACFPGTGGTQKNAADLGGGAFRSLGNAPLPGFADQKEAIPSHLNHGQAKRASHSPHQNLPRGHHPAASFIAARIRSSDR